MVGLSVGADDYLKPQPARAVARLRRGCSSPPPPHRHRAPTRQASGRSDSLTIDPTGRDVPAARRADRPDPHRVRRPRGAVRAPPTGPHQAPPIDAVWGQTWSATSTSSIATSATCAASPSTTTPARHGSSAPCEVSATDGLARAAPGWPCGAPLRLCPPDRLRRSGLGPVRRRGHRVGGHPSSPPGSSTTTSSRPVSAPSAEAAHVEEAFGSALLISFAVALLDLGPHGPSGDRIPSTRRVQRSTTQVSHAAAVDRRGPVRGTRAQPRPGPSSTSSTPSTAWPNASATSSELGAASSPTSPARDAQPTGHDRDAPRRSAVGATSIRANPCGAARRHATAAPPGEDISAAPRAEEGPGPTRARSAPAPACP